MPGVSAAAQYSKVAVEIGGLTICLHCDNPAFIRLVTGRYAGYIGDSDRAAFDFDIEIAPQSAELGDEDLSVTWNSGRWLMDRGDFHAEFNPTAACGRIRQTINPFSLDSVLRIVHTLLLAKNGGFLVHASSAIRHGRAFLFAGISGSGKTTIARLAPPDTALLTDEISYVIPQDGGYFAVGTPFYGELARVGENLRAPIECVYLLAKGKENNIQPVAGAEAVRSLLGNVLFFARDTEYVKLVFDAAYDFARRVPIQRLTFVPDARVWELIK